MNERKADSKETDTDTLANETSSKHFDSSELRKSTPKHSFLWTGIRLTNF